MHSTVTFQPRLLGIHLSMIAVTDHDYGEHVMHTLGLHRRRVQCSHDRLQWDCYSREHQVLSACQHTQCQHMVAPNVRIFHESDAIEKQSHGTLNSSAVGCSWLPMPWHSKLQFIIACMAVCARNDQISVISVFYDGISGMARTQVSCINCVSCRPKTRSLDNAIRTVFTKVYQNWPAFVDDAMKTFWCVFLASQFQLLFTYKTRTLSFTK